MSEKAIPQFYHERISTQSGEDLLEEDPESLLIDDDLEAPAVETEDVEVPDPTEDYTEEVEDPEEEVEIPETPEEDTETIYLRQEPSKRPSRYLASRYAAKRRLEAKESRRLRR